jgi:hypothetical protein
MVFYNHIPRRVYDTQLGAQGMEGICELWNSLVPLLTECGPSRLLVIVVSNRVILFLDGIHKIFPSGIIPKYSRILDFSLTVSLKPMFDMGDQLKECNGDIFPVGKIMYREITL